jgi:hypothetical protein
VWAEELPLDYPDRQYLLDGIRDGFHIVDMQHVVQSSEQSNYRSATNSVNRPLVEKQIDAEIRNGRYKIVSTKPTLVSALGAIPKKEKGKVRLIQDCSRPLGASLNDFAEISPFKYQSIQDAVDLLKPGYYMCKCDLESAFRSVKIHPSNYEATGLKWRFQGDSLATYMVDTRLPQGARRSPEIFNKLTQAVRAIMKKKGFDIVAYLDDFWLAGRTYEECMRALNTLIALLRKLGFAINYSKVEGPRQQLTFLGILFDSLAMTLQLPADKLKVLHTEICEFYLRSKVSKRELQSLAGKLNWATSVIHGGRYHLRRLLDRINTLRQAWHRTRVTQDMKADLQFWIDYMCYFNGRTKMLDSRPATPICIDACQVAGGGYHNGEMVYTPWEAISPEVASLHINDKEVLALELAITQWAPKLRDRKVYVHCDSMVACAVIKRGSSRNPIVMASLRRVFWLSAVYNFKIRTWFYPGVRNIVADRISRLHEPGGWQKLMSVWPREYHPPLY